MMRARLPRTFVLLFAFGLLACDCKDEPGSDGGLPDGTPDGPNGTCGSSTLETGEACDDGNTTAGDGCSASCTIEPGYTCPTPGELCVGCGDGVLVEGEFCDDDNNVAGDGCSPTCTREPGWDCIAEVCTPSACGDGFKVGPEECDDGNRVSGDGCSVLCRVEPNWVCVTPNFPCREAECGDGAVEAQEQCDDGDADNSPPGCDGMCRLVTGYHCPTPGQPCVSITCGDGVVQGLETCDDGGNAAPGCDAQCQIEDGYHCPTPGQACVVAGCGNGVREGNEACDDGDTTPGDGCDGDCEIEPFYECEGAPGAQSLCTKPIEFVRIALFDAPMDQPQALHYDPRSRSFVAYDYNAADANAAQEFCLDGTTPDDPARDEHLEDRRDEVGMGGMGEGLDGAAYDPFRDRFLFIRQDGRLFEIDRDNNVTASIDAFQLNGLGTAGGVQVGDDGSIYATNHFHPDSDGPGLIRVFRRNPDGSLNPNSVDDFSPLIPNNRYLDNIFNIPGLGWIGYYNVPNPAFPAPNQAHQGFTFHRYDGSVVGVSSIPGVLFRNGNRFPGNADGGEAATDGGFFLVCSEYLDDEDETFDNGICQLFAQVCTTSLDCAERVPGTVCKLDAEIPYCYAPTVARDDRYTIARDAPATPLDVMANDSFSDTVCAGADPLITAVTPGDHGGTIAIAGGGTHISYTPMGGQCGFVETFTYTANLGGGVSDTAQVQVTVPCVCGNDIVEPGEDCDEGDTTPGDGCSATCQTESACGNGIVEAGEQCDDDNVMAGDGCSPVCTVEIE